MVLLWLSGNIWYKQRPKSVGSPLIQISQLQISDNTTFHEGLRRCLAICIKFYSKSWFYRISNQLNNKSAIFVKICGFNSKTRLVFANVHEFSHTTYKYLVDRDNYSFATENWNMRWYVCKVVIHIQLRNYLDFILYS